MAETKREIYLRAIEEALGLALPAPKEGDPAAQVTEAMRYSLLCGGTVSYTHLRAHET